MDSRGPYSYGSEGSATAVAEQPLALSADKKKPVLVTGAAGLVGIHTCRELTKNGWQVRALIRDPARAAMALGQLPVEFRVGDVRDATTLRNCLSGCGAVVHLAAIAMLVVWAVVTFTTTAPGWIHILLTMGMFLLIYRIVVRGTRGVDRGRKSDGQPRS